MIILILSILGLIFGSFISALTWRLHEQASLEQRKKNKVTGDQLKKLSIVRGRSICPSCKHQLYVQDLVPLFSWLALRGKCRYCKVAISWQYPLIELSTAILFVVSWVFWARPLAGANLTEFIVWLVFLTGLIALAVYDLRWFLLPNRIVYPLIGIAIVQLAINVIFYNGGFNVISGAFWGLIIAGGIFFGLFQLSRGKWIGGGDVKLGTCLGLMLGGPFNSILMLLIASCSGTLIALPFVLAGKAKRNTHLPFGPLLVIGAIVVRLFGASINRWLTGV